MAVVVRPRFVSVVLALKSDRVGQAFLPRPVRALFRDFAPGFVLRRPGYVAVVVGSCCGVPRWYQAKASSGSALGL